MSKLRVVTPDDAAHTEQRQRLAELCEAALRDALAQEPLAMCIVFETADRIEWRSIPNAGCVALGLLRMARAAMEAGE